MDTQDTTPAQDQTPVVDPGAGNPPAQEQPVSDTPDPGVPVGEPITSPAGHDEIIVEDKDDQGNVIGWHKEAA